jgi:hypothetical protein
MPVWETSLYILAGYKAVIWLKDLFRGSKSTAVEQRQIDA